MGSMHESPDDVPCVNPWHVSIHTSGILMARISLQALAKNKKKKTA
jgi:hypothetical protein